jgi:hypothetical protein
MKKGIAVLLAVLFVVSLTAIAANTRDDGGYGCDGGEDGGYGPFNPLHIMREPKRT